jgi:hypothetical protein
MKNLYSYTNSWQDIKNARTLRKSVKKGTLLKLCLVTLVLPFDIVFVIFQKIANKKVSGFVATQKWPEFNKVLNKHNNIGFIHTPDKFIENLNSTMVYIPASPVYFLSALGWLLPSKYYNNWTNLVIKFNVFYLKSYLPESCKKSFLIVHSDALPFARSLVFGCNKLKIKTICIQHGTFHKKNTILEVDGSKSDINVVRSEEDRAIIEKIAPNSQYLVMPEFFLLNIPKNIVINDRLPRIVLVGEGYHILDEDFHNIYMKRLETVFLEFLPFECNCFFRPHPSEKFLTIPKTFNKIDKSSLVESISKADCLIGYSSSLLYEAASSGNPFISS